MRKTDFIRTPVIFDEFNQVNYLFLIFFQLGGAHNIPVVVKTTNVIRDSGRYCIQSTNMFKFIQILSYNINLFSQYSRSKFGHLKPHRDIE